MPLLSRDWARGRSRACTKQQRRYKGIICIQTCMCRTENAIVFLLTDRFTKTNTPKRVHVLDILWMFTQDMSIISILWHVTWRYVWMPVYSLYRYLKNILASSSSMWKHKKFIFYPWCHWETPALLLRSLRAEQHYLGRLWSVTSHVWSPRFCSLVLREKTRYWSETIW